MGSNLFLLGDHFYFGIKNAIAHVHVHGQQKTRHNGRVWLVDAMGCNNCLTCNCIPSNMLFMKLDQYLTDENVSPIDFAKEIGRDAATVSRLRRELTRPDWETVRRITEATKGRVTANDFTPPAPSHAEASQ